MKKNYKTKEVKEKIKTKSFFTDRLRRTNILCKAAGFVLLGKLIEHHQVLTTTSAWHGFEVRFRFEVLIFV